MHYHNILSDIEQLIGKELKSIKPGSEITLTEIDRDAGRVELRTSTGKLVTRPLSEIQKIWEHLQQKPAVHVDTVLGGSGSSRNQPETVVANLPYIEWGFIKKKKHLIFVGNRTHILGTLRQIDVLRLEQIKQDMLTQAKEGNINALIITDDLHRHTSEFTAITGISFTAIRPGIYEHDDGQTRFLVIDSKSADSFLEKKTYIVLSAKIRPNYGRKLSIDSYEFYYVNHGVEYIAQII